AMASVHHISAVVPPPPLTPKPTTGPPRGNMKNMARLRLKSTNSTTATAPKTTPDIARDLSSVDAKRQTAHDHSDHMNTTASDSRIVTKSIPPSRKLIARNGAIAANSVAIFTPCASSLP